METQRDLQMENGKFCEVKKNLEDKRENLFDSQTCDTIIWRIKPQILYKSYVFFKKSVVDQKNVENVQKW